MENFVLYEELGRTQHSTVYKGRRRGTIYYVAVICIEKTRRSRATNWVRCIHALQPHTNIVKFKEWYETNRHLWLVIDLCSGGTLRGILDADEKLPLETVKLFALDIVRGLYFLHSQGGIVHGDITPDRIYLDGSSNLLKISNLSLAQKESENLGDIFKQIDADCNLESLLVRDWRYRPAEEDRNVGTFSGDMYALGCILYEMYIGKPPEGTEDLENLQNGLIPDEQLTDLIVRLLEPEESLRMKWRELLIHPYWSGRLSDLLDTEHNDLTHTLTDTVMDVNSVADSLNMSVSEPQEAAPKASSVPVSTSSSGDSDHTLTPSRESIQARERVDSDTLTVKSELDESKPMIPTPRRDQTKSADVYKKKKKMAAIKRTNSRQENVSRPGSTTGSRNLVSSRARAGFADISALTLDEIMRCSSPADMTGIMENHKIWKFHLVSARTKVNPQLQSNLRQSLGAALGKATAPSVNAECLSSAVQECVNYFQQCSPNEKIVHYLLELLYGICVRLDDDPDVLSKLVPVLLRYLQFKNSPNKYETRLRAARVLAVLVKKLRTDVRFLDVLNVLINDLRMNNSQKNVKPDYRCYFLACLIDTAFYLEKGIVADGRLQLITQILTRSLAEGHGGIQLICLKGLENLRLAATIQQANPVWNCLRHATNDAVKVQAARILSSMPNMYNHLGLIIGYLDASTTSRVIGHMLTITIDMIRGKKEIHSVEIPKIIAKLLKLLDSTSPVVRGRSYLALALLAAPTKSTRSTYVADICTAKVISTIERELRRNVVSAMRERTTSVRGSSNPSPGPNQERHSSDVTLSQCLSYFGETVCEATRNNLQEITDLFSGSPVGEGQSERFSMRLTRADQKFVVKTLQSSVHMASSNIFRRIFITPELNLQLDTILRSLIRVAGSTISLAWFDEVAIELLVIIQSVVDCTDNSIIASLLTLISTKCVSSDPPKAVAVRVAGDLLEAKMSQRPSSANRNRLIEQLLADSVAAEQSPNVYKPSTEFIEGIREAMHGHSQHSAGGNHATSAHSLTGSTGLAAVGHEHHILPDHHITIYHSCRLFLHIYQLLSGRPSSSSSQLTKTSASFQELFYDNPEDQSTFFLQQHLVRTLYHYNRHNFPAALVILRTLKQIISDDLAQSYVQNLLKFGIADILTDIYGNVVRQCLISQSNEEVGQGDGLPPRAGSAMGSVSKSSGLATTDPEVLLDSESVALKLIHASCKAISSLVIQGKDQPETPADAKLALANAQPFANLVPSLLKRLVSYSTDTSSDQKPRISLLNTARVLFIVLQLYGVQKHTEQNLPCFTRILNDRSVFVKNQQTEVLKLIIKSFRRYLKFIDANGLTKSVDSRTLKELKGTEKLKEMFKEDSAIAGLLHDISTTLA